MFIPDRPIESENEDFLGRKHFSKQLASALTSWQDQGSLTVALYGKWGTGKSSVINLARINPNRLRFLAQIGKKSTNQYLQRLIEERCYPVLLATLRQSLIDITDEIIDMYDLCLIDRPDGFSGTILSPDTSHRRSGVVIRQLRINDKLIKCFIDSF